MLRLTGPRSPIDRSFHKRALRKKAQMKNIDLTIELELSCVSKQQVFKTLSPDVEQLSKYFQSANKMFYGIFAIVNHLALH